MNFAAEAASYETLQDSAWWRGKGGALSLMVPSPSDASQEADLLRIPRVNKEGNTELEIQTLLPGQTVFSMSHRVSAESTLSGYLLGGIPVIEALAQTIAPSWTEEKSLRQ